MTITMEGISLHVKDIAKSVEFYSKIPGANLIAEHGGRFARFKIGDSVIHVVQIPSTNKFHIEFNTDDVDGAHKALADAGIEGSEPQRHPWRKRDFRVVDPDGNLLEFGKFEGE